MLEDYEICSMIENGTVLTNVPGRSVEEIYKFACRNSNLPLGLDAEALEKELIARERILSTAVGKGFSIPHPGRPLVKSPEDKRVIVCFLKNPIDMNAPDGRYVSVMFILLSDSTKSHIKALSGLAKLFRNPQFINFMSAKPSKNDLIEKIRQINSTEVYELCS